MDDPALAEPYWCGDVPISVEQIGRVFTRWDVLAILLTISLLVFLAETSRHLLQPLAELRQVPVSLDPHFLPEYAARTTLRMLGPGFRNVPEEFQAGGDFREKGIAKRIRDLWK
jgi:hypothetical protein